MNSLVGIVRLRTKSHGVFFFFLKKRLPINKATYKALYSNIDNGGILCDPAKVLT
jgi:hypothetical protein